MSVNFCHIAPTAYLEPFTITNGAHLILAHLVEEDPVYADFYANLDDGKEKIMDNSAFEMYKQGRPMYNTKKLLTMARKCKADMIVMSDYPNEPAKKTIDSAIATASEYHDAGFETFYVPQSKIGDLHDYIMGIAWGLENDRFVDRIGLSILACPNAYGVEKGNKLQRYLSRYAILKELERQHLISQWPTSRQKKIVHCLGMVDGPNEIELLKPYHDYIATWDSSAAVWAGLNGIRFDSSPTGLIDGKFEKEVDFSYANELSSKTVSDVFFNIRTIDKMAA